jgi:putative transposase
VEEKVSLAGQVRGEYSLSDALRVLSLARSTYYYHVGGKVSYAEKYEHLRVPLELIARSHPEYGYRRAAAELSEMRGEVINGKVVRRLHKLWDLPILRTVRAPRVGGVLKAIEAAGDRANLVESLKEIGPFEVGYTDFTDLKYGGGIAQFIPIVDHKVKAVIGWALDAHKTAEVALRAWGRAKATLRRLGRSHRGMIVHHDLGGAFISYRWADRLVRRDGARLSFALNGAKDNTAMESFFGRFKTENRTLLLDAGTLDELAAVVARRIRYYNWERRHSSLGNQAPMRYVKSLTDRK